VANMAVTPPLTTIGKQTNGPQVIAAEMLFICSGYGIYNHILGNLLLAFGSEQGENRP